MWWSNAPSYVTIPKWCMEAFQFVCLSLSNWWGVPCQRYSTNMVQLNKRNRTQTSPKRNVGKLVLQNNAKCCLLLIKRCQSRTKQRGSSSQPFLFANHDLPRGGIVHSTFDSQVISANHVEIMHSGSYGHTSMVWLCQQHRDSTPIGVTTSM